MTDRSAYVQKMKVQVALWDAEIAKLGAMGSRGGASARLALEQATRDLARLRDAAQTKLDEAEATADDAWGEVEEAFEVAWHDLSDSVRSLKNRVLENTLGVQQKPQG